MGEYKKDETELGALWVRTNPDGSKRMTGTINGVDVVCWPVKSDNPKAPAFRVKKSLPRESRPQPEPAASSDIPW